jgi:CRP-like cAMP-binding protein
MSVTDAARNSIGRRIGAVTASEGPETAEIVAALRALADATEVLGSMPACRIEQFVPGRRSDIEQRHPGMGSSDGIALVTGGAPDANRCIVLFEVGFRHPRLALDATLSWPDESAGGVLEGWDRRPVPLDESAGAALGSVLILPELDFTDEDLGFCHGFLRRAVLKLRLTWDDVEICGDTAEIGVCDIRLLGTLYRRIADDVVAPDVVRQADAWARSDERPGYVHHPWAPVLEIGMDKASLYAEALVDDIVAKSGHLSDPSWLLRVGIYLELVTCLGIVEAFRSDGDDLLSPAERHAFEHDDAWAEIRSRVRPEAWREVWALARMSAPRLGVLRAGPVSVTNLIQKKRATLAFLHAHHQDLKEAIELAGPNLHNSQETWQRVFRDAERGVLRKTEEVFPELEALPGPMRELVLWQDGVGGQQGLYPTACTQYRASMNDVADWALDRGLMAYTGEECIPIGMSLIEAMISDPDRVETLERADGADGSSVPVRRVEDSAESSSQTTLKEIDELLNSSPIMGFLSAQERRQLAVEAVPLLAVPGERIVLEGDEGDSLFVIADGEVEVLVTVDGRQRQVGLMGRGEVIGEMALLTGEPRNATVRAVDPVLILEIGRRSYESVLRTHPDWVDDLAAMMEARLADTGAWLARGDRPRRRTRRRSTAKIRAEIHARFFADVPT